MITFKRYKKVARTFARPLTAQDYEERQGVVHAPEGILKFTPDDYLVINDGSAWPVACEIFEQSYVLAEEGSGEMV